MVFKEAWVSDEDKDLIGNTVDALLWVEICKHKSLIVKGKQEHEIDHVKFPYDGVRVHEEALLYLMAYAWEKCDLLSLEDQKKILDDIGEEMGFENNQSNDEGPNEEVFLEEAQKEIHDKAFEGTSYDDIESVECPLLQNENNDRDHDLLSDLIHDDPIIHDDHWSSFGLLLFDSSNS